MSTPKMKGWGGCGVDVRRLDVGMIVTEEEKILLEH